MPDGNGLVVIVGAGPGVGAAVARAFAGEGRRLLLIARNPERLDQLAAELKDSGASVETATADASVPGALEHVINGLNEPISVLVYNAAGMGGPLLEADPEEIRSATEINLHSLIGAARAARPRFAESQGTILVTGGGFALYPSSDFGVLSVGKAAIRAAALVLAQELKPQGIRVVTITIAGVVAPDTPFSPDRIAKVYVEAATADSVEPEIVFTGQ